jgi:RNA polymerase sigma-70 factor (ECF subfamily)
MKALKPVHRACLILRYVHGMDRSEIATRLGLRENQVKGHLQYALTLLRRELERTP